MSETINRVVFRHHGDYDFRISATSLTTGIEEWENFLRGHVRIQHDRRPEHSMWYWHENEQAVVLWRVKGSSVGRDDRCHGLIGSVRLLDTETALALTDWSGWDDTGWQPDADGRLSPIKPYDINNLPLLDSRNSSRAACMDVVSAFLNEPHQPRSRI